MSVEALAMAGVSYMESGIIFEKLEVCYTTPPYLVVVAEEIQSCRLKIGAHRKQNEEMMKANIKEWAKAVASAQGSIGVRVGNL